MLPLPADDLRPRRQRVRRVGRERDREVDTSAPAAPSLGFGSFTNASVTGSTVFFRSGVAGGFTRHRHLVATPSPGIASPTFPALGADWSAAAPTPARSTGRVHVQRRRGGTGRQPGRHRHEQRRDRVGRDAVHGRRRQHRPGELDPAATRGACAPWFTSLPVSVTLSASDGGSGVYRDPLHARRLRSGRVERALLGAALDRGDDDGQVPRLRHGREHRGRADPARPDRHAAPSVPTLALRQLDERGRDRHDRLRAHRRGGRLHRHRHLERRRLRRRLAHLPHPRRRLDRRRHRPELALRGRLHLRRRGVGSGGAQNVTADERRRPRSRRPRPSPSSPTRPRRPARALCDGGACAPWFTTSPVSVGALRERRRLGPRRRSATRSTAPIRPGAACSTRCRSRSQRRRPSSSARYDRVGNEESVGTAVVQVDTTQPSVPALTLGESDPDSHIIGSTLYYNPSGANAGSFTVDATASDAESAIDRIGFPAIAGVTGGGDDFSSPYAGAYDWTSATGASGAADGDRAQRRRAHPHRRTSR